MGFDFEEKKTFLHAADLFKLEENRHNNSWNNSSASCDSSSSGFNSPFGSESEDGDFTAVLSRQMAECMLHEEEEEETNNSAPLPLHQTFKYGSNSNRPVLDHSNRTPCIKLKSQCPVGVSRGRRVSGAELSRHMRTRKTEQRYRDGGWRNGPGGSGMRAIFLGGSGSTYGSSGTGVFLPRVTNNDPVEQKHKSGVSTVLIPTRVLEALEQHFTRLSDSEAVPSLAPAASSHYLSTRDEWVRSKGNKHRKVANKVEEIQILPQEWTY